MRVFVAFDLPDSVKSKILKLESMIKKKSKRIRLVGSDNMHITLKFLGEQPYQAVNRIIELAGEVARVHSPFEINLNRAGVFKDLVNPRVLWLGEENGEYVNITNDINEKLDIFRLSDNSPFCHLTIGRMKWIEKGEVLDVLRLCRDFLNREKIGFSVNSFYLYESILSPKGAVYKKIEKFSLR